jgi:hypothetical protein
MLCMMRYQQKAAEVQFLEIKAVIMQNLCSNYSEPPCVVA